MYPQGWDEARVKRVLAHYESQSEEEAVAEDEAAFKATDQTVMGIPTELVPKVRQLIAKQRTARERPRKRLKLNLLECWCAATCPLAAR